MPFAKFGQRTTALVLDGLLLYPVLLAIRAFNPYGAHSMSSNILWSLIVWVYFAAMEFSRWQATVGKRLMGLQVTNKKGAPISLLQSSVRSFARMLSGACLGLGYLLALVTPRHQCLHDLLASSLVLARPAGNQF